MPVTAAAVCAVPDDSDPSPLRSNGPSEVPWAIARPQRPPRSRLPSTFRRPLVVWKPDRAARPLPRASRFARSSPPPLLALPTRLSPFVPLAVLVVEASPNARATPAAREWLAAVAAAMTACMSSRSRWATALIVAPSASTRRRSAFIVDTTTAGLDGGRAGRCDTVALSLPSPAASTLPSLPDTVSADSGTSTGSGVPASVASSAAGAWLAAMRAQWGSGSAWEARVQGTCARVIQCTHAQRERGRGKQRSHNGVGARVTHGRRTGLPAPWLPAPAPPRGHGDGRGREPRSRCPHDSPP